MRKNNVLTGLIMAVMLMVSANLFATDYEVSGAGIADINGTYVENGTNCGKPKYEFTNGGTTYYLAFNNIDFGDYWIIGESAALVDMPGSEYYISSSSDTPPSDGWNVMGSGDPAPTVSLARPNLSRNADIFYESTDNDGSIANTITITYNLPEGDSFSGSNGTFSTDNYTTANVPAGLSVSITKNSDTELSVALTGNASSHAYTDDISNLEITFLDAAFTNGDASAVNNSTQSNIEVDYGLLITSLTDLQTLSNTSANWDEYIIQTIDIDASATSGWNSGAGFSPIGNSTTKFTGYYNGGDHSIDNLFINRPATDYIGLFGYVDGATIKNIGVTNVDISGEYYVGGLVGYNNNSSAVNNSYSSGSVTGNNRYVGGLVGQNYNSSTITNSYSSGSVTGSADYTGGLSREEYNFNNYQFLQQ
ncbi:MAG: GLUG motif-containing protein [candidate division KSB1 bacterium]|nr:GLUG motif-containing protein [candidate division KSB1 bacterium]